MKSWLLGLLLPFALVQDKTYTVGEVMRNARRLHNDSTTVQLIGYFTKKLNNNNYVFEDRTAEIHVNVPPKFLPGRPLSDREAVTIKVWVEYEMDKPITLTVNQPIN
ncbi:NirD/YgiW/YdeI family stress tolerance protein [Chitinophaga eiseniae]|uniref:NirD/YgiW/YdeI family stress tolerance protein n=1 Tax=Chitinophaga eiseniae TaxID=634771 RepID=A0A847SAH1_9BACT|nr:NirD/YgiW/YdeI family stress tolerance protein [Chitinophaga eiseniae]NLR77064.1 NirD/YgiW/YdeI family stress tolerance protein [Chitinophaga eiseniae]